jgi:hypothetical protein
MYAVPRFREQLRGILLVVDLNLVIALKLFVENFENSAGEMMIPAYVEDEMENLGEDWDDYFGNYDWLLGKVKE